MTDHKEYYYGLSTAYSIQSNMVEDALDGRTPLEQVFTALRRQQLDASEKAIRDNDGGKQNDRCIHDRGHGDDHACRGRCI